MLDLSPMSQFQELKLDGELLARVERLGYLRPTALQREAVPVIARGTTVVGTASAGSGKTLAYTLGLAARLDPDTTSLQALVLRPTDDAAAATADSLHTVMQARQLRVQVCRPAERVNAHVAVASPATALSAVEHSTVKLADLSAIVVDGAAAIFDLDGGAALETLSGQVPKEAQRVLLTSRLSDQVEDWIERHARRARKLVYLPAEIEPLGGSVEYFAGPRAVWLPHLTALLASGGASRTANCRILCPTEAQANALAHRLAVRGFGAGVEDDGADVRIDWREAAASDAALSVLWGAPPDLDTFLPRVRDAGRAVVFTEPDELGHVHRLAARVQTELQGLKTRAPEESHQSLQATREALLAAARERDLEPYVLLIEPLFEHYTPVEIAAAATALLRESEPSAPAPRLPAWTRLYFAVGRRDGIRPADIVGAIAGESPASGDEIGRIEIRDTHSLVEIAAPVADQVIKALARTTIRGRPANVRVFRE